MEAMNQKNLLETLSEPLKLVNMKSKEIFETIVKDVGNYRNREESTFIRKKPSKHELTSLSLIADNLVVSDPLTEPTPRSIEGIHPPSPARV